MNLPLIWMIIRFWGTPQVIGCAFRHAPNQFVFLLVFFPMGILATRELVLRLSAIYDHHQDRLKNTRWRRFGGTQARAMAVFLMLGFVVGYTDHLGLAPDFYQFADEAGAHEACELIHRLAETEVSTVDAEVAVHTEVTDDAQERLTGIYAKAQWDDLTWLLELIEAIVAISLGVPVLACSILALRLRLAKKYADIPGLSNDVAVVAPYIALATLAFATWAPLRAHNLAELAWAADGPIPTIRPVYVVPVFVVALAYALVTYYGEKVLEGKRAKAIVGVASSLSVMGIFSWFSYRPAGLSAVLYDTSLPEAIILFVLIGMAAYLLYVVLVAGARNRVDPFPAK